MNPTIANGLGLHQYAGYLPKISKENIKKGVSKLREFEKKFEAIDKDKLPKMQQYELDLILYDIRLKIFEFEELKIMEKNTAVYTFLLGITDFFLKQYAHPEIRMNDLLIRLKEVPSLLERAKEMIEIPIGKPFQELTLMMIAGQMKYYQDFGIPEAKKLASEAQFNELEQAFHAALKAMNEFREFIANAETTDEFALGPDLYKKLQYYENALDISLDKLEEIAKRDLQRNKTLVEELVKKHFPDKSISEVLEEIKNDHPTAETLIEETEKTLETIRTMVIEKEIVSIPSEVRCKTIPTPQAYRSFAFAAMDPPGAFEVIASEAYYYVTPPEDEWEEKQKEEWLTIFNYPQLEDISVHEAYPGHYVHFLHFRHRCESKIAKIITSYHFIEGWAHYVEEVVYGELGYRKEDPKYRIAQLLESLVRNARFLSSIYLHTKPGFTVEDAQKIFVEDGLMEPKPAYTEALRGTFDPSYLNYTLGKLLILKLREDYFEENPQATLKQFHDEILKYGAPPVPILRKYILKNTDKAPL